MLKRVLDVIGIKLSPRPNRSLEDVVKRITGLATLPPPDPKDDVRILRAGKALREMALVGPLSIFGGVGWRTTAPADYGRMTRKLIPRDFWKDHEIELTGFLGQEAGDRRGRTRHTGDGHGDEDDYYGIWFDKHEIDTFWPRQK